MAHHPATKKRGGNPDVKHKPEHRKPKDAMEGSDPVSVTQPPKTKHHEKKEGFDTELTAELRSQARWKFARELLVVAERSEKRRDLVCAHRQLRQALRNDLLLYEE